MPITIGAVSASLTAPAQVAAGTKFKVSWTGPNNPRDFVTMVKAGTREKTYERYVYTDKGPTLEFTAPDEPGSYELRYATGTAYLTLARVSITVGAISGTITGPAQAVAGETFKVSWKGPDNARNFVTVVPKGASEGAYTGSYFYTTPQNNPGNLVAPLAPGEYELRYSTAESYITLARAADTASGTLPSRIGIMASSLSTGLKPGSLAALSF